MAENSSVYRSSFCFVKFVCLFVGTFVTANEASAVVVNVDFGGGAGVYADQGALPSAGSTWNSGLITDGTSGPLVNSQGGGTGIGYSISGIFADGSANEDSEFVDVAPLLGDYVFATDNDPNSHLDLLITGLVPNDPYDIALYGVSNSTFDSFLTDNRGSVFTVNGGSSQTSTGTNTGLGDTFVAGQTHVTFLSVNANSSGEIDVDIDPFTQPGDSAYETAFLNGFQIEGAEPDSVELAINRDTGALRLTNNTISPFTMAGLSITSSIGSLNPTEWLSIAGHYDMDSGGSVDPNNSWVEFSSAVDDLSEGTLGTVVVAASQSIDFGNAWVRGPLEQEDIDVQLLLEDGTVLDPIVAYTGNGDESFALGDLDFVNGVDAADWAIYKAGFGADLSGLSLVEGYQMGDLNYDGVNDGIDFRLFKSAYEALQGIGSFDELIVGVPEPTSMALLGIFGLVGLTSRRHMRLPNSIWSLAIAIFSVLAITTTASATTVNVDFGSGVTYSDQGVFTTAGSTWNQGLSSDGSSGALVDSLGNASTVGYTIGGIVGTGTLNEGGEFVAIAELQSDYVFGLTNDPNSRLDLLITGLIPNTLYDLVLHATSNSTFDGFLGDNRGSIFTVGGTSKNSTGTNVGLGDAFVEGQTHATFLNVTSNGSGEIDVDIHGYTGAGSGTGGPDSDFTNAFLNGFQIDLPSAGAFELTVNTVTGNATLTNNTLGALDIDFYQISSASGALNPGGWNSLEDQDFEGGGGASGNGDGWEELGSSNLDGDFDLDGDVDGMDFLAWQRGDSPNNGSAGELVDWKANYGASGGTGNDQLIAEAYLLGSSTIAQSQVISLGNAFNTNVFGSGVDGDLQFTYQLDNGSVIPGTVSYVTSLSATRPVPEPTSLSLAFLAWLGAAELAGRRSRARHPVQIRHGKGIHAACVAVIVWVVGGSSVVASVTLDRDYTLGDDSVEDAANAVGGVVGTGPANPHPGNATLDSKGVSSTGNFQDLIQAGGPVYVDVGSGGLNRPGAALGSWGVQFDGSDDRLRGSNADCSSFGCQGGLGFPGDPTPQNPYDNYAQIFTRGIQLWAYPTNSGSAARQDLINDTYQFGLHITDNNNWGMTWGSDFGGNIGREVESNEAVTYNDWTHVMQHSYGSGGSVLVINGIIVTTSGFNGTEFYHQQNQNANLDITVSSNLDTNGGFYTGTLDAIKIYVAGDNTEVDPISPVTRPGQDYGTFNIGTDNDYIAGLSLQPGDATGDGNVEGDGTGDPNIDDVAFFIDHWGDEQEFGDIVLGDLNSRQNQADFNFDGVTDLLDWHILRTNHPTPASLNLGQLLASANVPEPSSVVLLLLGTVGVGLHQRHGQR